VLTRELMRADMSLESRTINLNTHKPKTQLTLDQLGALTQVEPLGNKTTDTRDT
jgi:hypothetical protein